MIFSSGIPAEALLQHSDRSGVRSERFYHASLPSKAAMDAFLYPEASGYYDCADNYCRSRTEHLHFLLILITAGGLSVRTSLGDFQAKAGEAVLLDTSRPHVYCSISEKAPSMYWLHFAGKPAGELISFLLEKNASAVFSVPTDFTILFPQLIVKLAAGSVPELQISVQIYEMLAMLEPSQSALSPVERSVAYIQKNYAQPIMIRQLAEISNLSLSHYCAQFKERYGISPHHYLIELRLSVGCHLLSETKLSVEEISRQIGYSTPSAFIGAFSQKYGRTPAQMRRAIQL